MSPSNYGAKGRPKAWRPAQCHSHSVETFSVAPNNGSFSSFPLFWDTVPHKPPVSRQRGSMLCRTLRSGHPYAVTFTADYGW